MHKLGGTNEHTRVPQTYVASYMELIGSETM